MSEPPRAGAARGPTIVVLAKAPVPGRVKTRLMTRFTPEQAASLAEAALLDTIDAARGVSEADVVLVLDGSPGDWLPTGLRVISQRGDGLAERIAAALDDAWAPGHPVLLIGMDTPQVTTLQLRQALSGLAEAGAVLGLADDGGWWVLGLHRPDARLLHDVPMSAANTGAVQLERLHEAQLSVALLEVMADVDTPADASLVAARAPHTRFARLHQRLVTAAPLASDALAAKL